MYDPVSRQEMRKLKMNDFQSHFKTELIFSIRDSI